jgi:glycosyltransferase involved in cell wall biosynthesis
VRLIYILLSPTFGMHQYTADLANGIASGLWRMAGGQSAIRYQESAIASPEVVVVTTTTLPRDRYGPAVRIETPVTTHGTGFSAEGLNVGGYRQVLRTISDRPSAMSRPPSRVVHFTGVHLWNVGLARTLRRRGVPVIHTLHDLHPHGGVRYGRLIGLWNRLIIGSGAHILIHGRRYRDELLAWGLAPEQVTYAPLLHGFWGAGSGETGTGNWKQEAGSWEETDNARNDGASSPQLPAAGPATVLFFGRVEAYKGVDVLLEAWEMVLRETTGARLVIAGPAARGESYAQSLASAMNRATTSRGIEWRNRLIEDDEAVELFRAASLLVLPYRDATQSALIAAAYRFGVPVVVTDVGALSEYVVPAETGWVVPACDAGALAAALLAALANPDRLGAMGKAGRAWYREQRKEEAEILAGMYEDALASCRGRGRVSQ